MGESDQIAMHFHEIRTATVQQDRIVEKEHASARTDGAAQNASVDLILVPIEDIEDYRGF